MKTQKHMDALALNDKFSAAEGSFTFTYGGMDMYHAGLEGLLVFLIMYIAPLTGLEVMGTPKVDAKTLVVELRLNTNLHDLTIQQVTAKLKKTHTDLVRTIKTDLQMVRLLKLPPMPPQLSSRFNRLDVHAPFFSCPSPYNNE